MTRRISAFGLLALALAVLLAGCASTDSSSAPVGASAAQTSGSGADKPTKTALMVCGDDISAEITLVLKLDGPAPTRSTFADDLFTCTYDLPIGPLILSVQHSDSASAASAYLDGQRARLAPTIDLIGLGERAFTTPSGVAVVLKDNETLTVDATGVPAVFGPDQQKRTDLAYEIASVVLGCWTGDDH